jgi:hypothetical protein
VVTEPLPLLPLVIDDCDDDVELLVDDEVVELAPVVGLSEFEVEAVTSDAVEVLPASEAAAT